MNNTTPLAVTAAEAGQKLLNFLQRRIEAPVGDLHRWIRTGQVRVNGRRTTAFERLNSDDLVRIPPFAQRKTAKTPYTCAITALSLHIVYEDEYLLAVDKPAGLPVQNGTSHTDSVAARLATARAGADFVPAPVHRLDRDTSGLLVAGKTYAATRLLSEAFTHTEPGAALRKYYLVWCYGSWPHEHAVTLRDHLRKDPRTQRVLLAPAPEGRPARCEVIPLEHRLIQGRSHTLLQVCLYTGLTHQIRVQLASRGFAVAGDPWYGESHESRPALKLHAFRLSLPLPSGKIKRLELLPPWIGDWRVEPDSLPPWPENTQIC